MPLPSAARDAVGPTRRIGLAAYCPGEDQAARCWQLDLEHGMSTSASYESSARAPHVDWLMTGDVRTWMSILSGDEKVSVSFRLRALRYIDFNESGNENSKERSRKATGSLKMITHLLDIDERQGG